MKIKQLLYITCLAAVVTACSSDDAAQPQGERVPIGLSYTTQPQTVSRAAAATNLNDGTIASGKQVKVFISNHLEDDYRDYVYTTGDAGAMTLPTPAPYYPMDGITNVDILAFYPATAGTSFTVLADQTSDDNYTASDLMWATPITNQARTTSNVALEFTHKMAKLVVTARKGTAIKEVNSVTLMNVKPTVSFNQTDGTIGAASGDAIEVKMVKDETADMVTGAAVFPAQTIDGQLLKIGVTMTNDETGFAYYSVDSKSFAANSVYTVDLTVSWPEVSATTAITSWGNGGTAAVTHSSQFLTFNVNGVEFKMVYVEGTDESFDLKVLNLGSSVYNEAITVTVQGLSDYFIGQTEVTNALWTAVMGTNPTSTHSGYDGANLPVSWVSFYDILGSDGLGTAEGCFMKKFNDIMESQLPAGMKFNLPTEMQWRWAFMGGKYSKGYMYGGTNDWNGVWSRDNTTYPQPVATKPANELGLYDMSGNVFDWTRDWYHEFTNGEVLSKDYVYTTQNSNAIINGGGCHHMKNNTTENSTGYNEKFTGRYRHSWPANNKSEVGFRLALQ